jgi:hypothetical protein
MLGKAATPLPFIIEEKEKARFIYNDQLVRLVKLFA